MKYLLFLVTYTAKHGMRDKFIEDVVSSGLQEKIRHEDGCISYDYYRAVEDDNVILLVEKWVSDEQQKNHMEHPNMIELKKIKEMYINDTKLERICVE